MFGTFFCATRYNIHYSVSRFNVDPRSAKCEFVKNLLPVHKPYDGFGWHLASTLVRSIMTQGVKWRSWSLKAEKIFSGQTPAKTQLQIAAKSSVLCCHFANLWIWLWWNWPCTVCTKLQTHPAVQLRCNKKDIELIDSDRIYRVSSDKISRRSGLGCTPRGRWSSQCWGMHAANNR